MKPIIRSVYICLIVVLLSAITISCLGGKQAAPTPDRQEKTGSSQGTGPVNVIAHLDTSAQVYALVPQKGGEINLSLANGLNYTLNIPSGALLSDQEVTMTPIRSIDGMPLSGGLIAGVQLEPDGTFLMKPATLTITVPQGYDLRSMVGFGYHGQGEGFYLSPAAGDGKAITIQIMSFSGHGAASGTDKEIKNQANTSTGSDEDDLYQQAADILHDAKTRRGYIDEIAMDKLVEVMKDIYDRTIRPDLLAAVNDDTKIDDAAYKFLSWWQQAQLIGLYDALQSRAEDGTNLLFKGLKNAYNKAYQRCIANQNIYEAENMLLRLYQLALLGYSEDLINTDKVQNEFYNCLRYKLNLDSIITWELENNMNITAQVAGSVIMYLKNMNGMIFQGSGPLEYKNYSIEFVKESEKLNSLCNIQTLQKGGRLEAYGRISWINLNSKKPKINTVIAVRPSYLDEKITEWKCTSDASGEMNIEVKFPLSLPMWGAGFDQVHQDIKTGIEDFDDSYVFSGFEYVGGRVVARLAQSKMKEVAQAKVTDDLTIDIFAAPGAR